MTFGELFGIRKIALFAIDTTNVCNLHCDNCFKQCNLPISPKSSIIFRRKVKVIDPDDVTLFCERFRGIGEKDIHQLSGGEPTTLPYTLFDEIINILSFYGRRINLTTNGFGLLGIKQNILNKIHQIVLDDHGTNSEHVQNCSNYLKKVFNGEVRVLFNNSHFDISSTMQGRHETLDTNCRMWLTQPSFAEKIIYPCCLLNSIRLASNTYKITNELRDAGWTIDNKNVVETLRNHNETIPEYIIDQCKNNCWHPGQPPKVKITSKSNDVIKRG